MRSTFSSASWGPPPAPRTRTRTQQKCFCGMRPRSDLNRIGTNSTGAQKVAARCCALSRGRVGRKWHLFFPRGGGAYFRGSACAPCDGGAPGVPPLAVRQALTLARARFTPTETRGPWQPSRRITWRRRAGLTVKRRLSRVCQQKLEKGSPWDPKGGTPRSNDIIFKVRLRGLMIHVDYALFHAISLS